MGFLGDIVVIILFILFVLVEDSFMFFFDYNYYDLLGWIVEKFGFFYIFCKGD